MRLPRAGPAGRLTSRPAAALLGVCLLVLAVEAFAPFRLDAPGPRANGARRLPDRIDFHGRNRAVTPAPPAWLEAVRDGAPFEVALTASAAEPHQPQVARLLAVSRDYQHADLVVAQYEEDLLVRVRRAGSDPSGEPPLRVAGVFATPSPRRIVVRRDGRRLVLEVDGRRESATDLGPSGLTRWDTSFRLALGDEHRGSRSWRGRLTDVTVVVAGRRFDYLAGGLEVPTRIWYVPERLRDWYRPGGMRDLTASALHGLSFLPVGALALVADRRRRRARAATVALVVSVVLVAGKVLFAGRHPSVIDLVAQALGGAVGVVLAYRLTETKSSNVAASPSSP